MSQNRHNWTPLPLVSSGYNGLWLD